MDERLHWYKDAVIYELHIKAFRDSNKDGFGDFNGLIEKLDYLKDLGVTAIWLLPFYPSPQKDDGYDISDYYNINPAYGSLEEFQTLLHEAHARQLRVITELVLNHTSDQHPWFQRARRAPRDSSERQFYVWTDDPAQYKDVRIIFQDFETSNWTWDPVAGQYYWHRFYHHQPDLNYDHPAVQREVFDIIDYWCKLGVDGFRLDAVPYLYEREGTNGENLPETHSFLKRLRSYVDEHYPGTLLLAEANMWPEDAASYFGEGDECHMNYHFPVMPRMYMALQTEDRYPITDIFDQTPDIPENCQWAIFLRNHDELTLEMVTDEERDYMYKTYVRDPRARINLGIRHRLAPLLGNNRKKIELMNYLLFSLPGTPVLYYGDEIGMGDNVYLGDRNGVRTPMQWSSDRNAGFSEGNPHYLYLPVILDPLYHYESVNVELQSSNTSSLWWWMKRMISKRKQFKAFGRGRMEFVANENPKILSFIRSWGEEIVLVVANLSRYTQPVALDLNTYSGYQPSELFSRNKFPLVRNEVPYFLTLGGHDCMWFILEKVHETPGADEDIPAIEISALSDFVQRPVVERLESDVLLPYMKTMRWFGGKGRVVERIEVLNTATLPLKTGQCFIFLIEIQYQSGLPELYQLPLAYCTGLMAEKIKTMCPKALVAQALVGDERGIFYDAIYGIDFQEALIAYMGKSRIISDKSGAIRFQATESVTSFVGETNNIQPRVIAAEQSNTSITYNGKFFLKLFRKFDKSINPDVELSRFLSEEANFKNVPAYGGSFEWKLSSGTLVLGMLQEMVENNGDAWSYMLSQLDQYNDEILIRRGMPLPELAGSLTQPLGFEYFPPVIQQLLKAPVAEHVRMLGVRTGEMHLALASRPELPDFAPEPYSLHYQRSLYAGLQSLVRTAFENQKQNMDSLDDELRADVQELQSRKGEILSFLKAIYRKRIEVAKIRIHGDYHLGQVLFTGRDFVVTDFEGEPARPYSERRLKRSALRDVAGMIRSFHYAAHASLLTDDQMPPDEIATLTPAAEMWYHYMSQVFLNAYLKTVSGSAFIPSSQEDFEILLNTFLMEKAVYELNYEVNNRPKWQAIPMRGIKSVLGNRVVGEFA